MGASAKSCMSGFDFSLVITFVLWLLCSVLFCHFVIWFDDLVFILRFCLFPVSEAEFDVFLSLILHARSELDSCLRHLPWVETAIALIYSPSLGFPPSKKRRALSSSTANSAGTVRKKQAIGTDFL